MLDKKVAELINTQVNKEFYSAYLYLDMANYYKDQSLDGFYNWYKVQAQEERDHAVLFMEYLQQNGESVVPVSYTHLYRNPQVAGAVFEGLQGYDSACFP